MFTMDLNARFRNKAFLIALGSAVLLLLKNFGLGKYIPLNIDSIVNGFITIGILLGVITDTSTPGISDQVIANATVQSVNNANTKEKVEAESSAVSVNSDVSEKSQCVQFNSYGIAATGNLNIASNDGTSQVEIKDSSINEKVQDNNSASSKIEVDIPNEEVI